MAIRIGIDLGGTKIEIIAIDDRGEILIRERQKTPYASYKKIVQTTADLVIKVEGSWEKKAPLVSPCQVPYPG